MSHQAVKKAEGWKAELELELTRRPDKTVLSKRLQRGPLAVQRPFYPEGDACHLYVLHPPGGVVGGDQLHIETRVASDASAVITTPGATKFYRSAGDQAFQQQSLYVDDGGSLEWMPQENIFFPGACCKLATDIHLQESAGFIGWEIQCLGRPANQEIFDHGQLRFSLRLFRNNRPLLLEHLDIAGKDSLSAISGLRNQPVLATLIATQADTLLLEALQEKFATPQNAHLGFTLLDDILLCRYLGPSTEQARNLFIKIWQHIRPLTIQREACPPRIWST